MKDIITPVPQEEVKAVIHNCLEQAALVNYQRLSEYAKVEGQYFERLKDQALQDPSWYWCYFEIPPILHYFRLTNVATDSNTLAVFSVSKCFISYL